MTGHPLFVTFFMLGTIVFFVGLGLRILLYLRGRWDGGALLKGFFSTLLSAKILELIKILFLDGIFQRRLFGQDKLRWLMKVLIMVGYPGILIAGHLKVEMMPQFERFPHMIRFFYAPFCDYYYFRDLAGPTLGFLDGLFAISFDLFGAMILTGELIAIYRRFVAKKVVFKTSIGDIVAVNLLGGWFILRFFCEATSILTYSLPDSAARYWFLSFGLSKILAPLGLPWTTLNDPVWALAGLFLAALIALIPFNKKLWHIVTIPVVMVINLMPEESFNPGSRQASLPLSVKELIALDSCVKCGSCVDLCPVYVQSKELETTMGGFFTSLKSFIRKAYGLPAMLFGPTETPRIPSEDSEYAYLCTLCGKCTAVCPAFIDTKGLRMGGRQFMVEKGSFPKIMNQLSQSLKKVHNILGEPSEDRPMWVRTLRDVPQDLFQREKAKVVYFVGCVASYFPMTKKIPQSFVQILDKAGVDFTILGGEEWCCGWPLIAAGMAKDAEALIRHNLEKVKERGAERIVFSCPSCYHTWREHCKTEIECFHTTQFIKKLIDERKIRFKETRMKVTYHDPCDLGRASGVYEAPRAVLRAIPGVTLVEMKENRERCTCCGGGGDIEMVRPELSSAMAQAKIDEIKASGADTVITACQQCVRTILTTCRRKKIPLSVMDITELILKSLDREGSKI